jgi:DNA-binding transcriptional regulator YhcF (GntR family)
MNNTNDSFHDDSSPLEDVPEMAGVRFKPKGGSSSKIHKSIIVPDAVRAFTPPEEEILFRLKYGPSQKPLEPSKRAKKSIALDNVKLVIHVIELNTVNRGPMKKRGAMLAIHELAKMLGGSVKTTSRVLDCLMDGGIVEVNRHFDVTRQIARRYKVSDRFKNAAVISRIKRNQEVARVRKIKAAADSELLDREIEALLDSVDTDELKKVYGFERET